MSSPQPNKLNNNLVQQFLLPDETPPILEAEMSLRAEQLINSTKLIVAPERRSKQEARSQEGTPVPQRQQEDVRSEMSEEKLQAKRDEKRMEQVKQVEETEERQEPEGRQADTTLTEQERKEVRIHAVRQCFIMCFYDSVNKQIEFYIFLGFLYEFCAFAPLLFQVRDVWYEAGTVWYLHKEGFTLGE